MFIPHNASFLCSSCDSNKTLTRNRKNEQPKCCTNYLDMNILPIYHEDSKFSYIAYIEIDLLLQQLRLLEIREEQKIFLTPTTCQALFTFMITSIHFYTSGRKIPEDLEHCTLFTSTINQLCSFIKNYSNEELNSKHINLKHRPIFLENGTFYTFAFFSLTKLEELF
ncbi:hypothetical protein HZS_4404 [Henneguya salminicola]|nr:hypothetical protein HZS_4404 [Henneguya salminicola]